MYTVKYCPICKKDLPNPYCIPEYFIRCLNPKEHDVSQFVDTGLSENDFEIINAVSDDVAFLESMITLKEKDPIEFQLKLSQFKTQAQQQQKQTQATNANIPHCPHCNSTNISQIGTGERAASIIGLGIFSKKINKSFKCKSCGYTW